AQPHHALPVSTAPYPTAHSLQSSNRSCTAQSYASASGRDTPLSKILQKITHSALRRAFFSLRGVYGSLCSSIERKKRAKRCEKRPCTFRKQSLSISIDSCKRVSITL